MLGGKGFFFCFFLFVCFWMRQTGRRDSTSQPRCPDGRVTHCAWINFCLCSPVSLFLPLHSSFLYSISNHVFPQTILSTRIECHKIIWFKVMRLQVLLFLLFLTGLLEFPLLSLTLLSKLEEFSIGQIWNQSWWWNITLKSNCSSKALESQL